MIDDPEKEFIMKKGLFIQDFTKHPLVKGMHSKVLYEKSLFHNKFLLWVLCGVNGSCTELNPLIFIQGGAAGRLLLLASQDLLSIGEYLMPPRTLMDILIPV